MSKRFYASSKHCIGSSSSCQLGALGRAALPRVPLARHMAPARRPSSSPARLHPSPRAHGGVLQGPGCDELLLIAKTLGLPLAQPSSSAELVAQITLAANEGKLRRPIQEGRGASLCTALVHAAFRLIDLNKDVAEMGHFGTLPRGTLPRSVVLKALRDSEQVRTLLQLLQAIRQEAGSCLVFEKARLAIESDGSKSITLDEFEAHFVPAPKQRKPRLSGRLLTGLSLSLVQVIAVYVIAAHVGLVSGHGSSAAARASIDTGGEQWGTAAVQAAAAKVSAAAAAATADPGAGSLSWADGVNVGIKSDDAEVAAPAKKGGVGEGRTYNVRAGEWATGDAHSARLLADRNAKVEKAKKEKAAEKAAEDAKGKQKKSAKQGKEGRSGGAAGGADTKEDMVRRFAEAAADEEADYSKEELTGRLKEGCPSYNPDPNPDPNTRCLRPAPDPRPYLVLALALVALGDGGRWHRQDAGDARPRAGLGRGGHGGDQGQGLLHDEGG